MSVSTAPTDEEVIRVIKRHVRGSVPPLEHSTYLELDRERAEALFKDLALNFGLTGEISIDSYFDGFRWSLEIPELSFPLRLIYPELRRQWRDAPPRPAMTVGHLLTVVQEGVWRDAPPRPQVEPLVWVGQKTLTPIFKALKTLSHAVAYLLALSIITGFVVQLIKVAQVALEGRWPNAIWQALGALMLGLVVMLMAESTQRHIEDRFGRLWDWRRGRLREPRRVTIKP